MSRKFIKKYYFLLKLSFNTREKAYEIADAIYNEFFEMRHNPSKSWPAAHAIWLDILI
jgi:hypothetical protein